MEWWRAPPLPNPLLHSEWRRGCPQGGGGGAHGRSHRLSLGNGVTVIAHRIRRWQPTPASTRQRNLPVKVLPAGHRSSRSMTQKGPRGRILLEAAHAPVTSGACRRSRDAPNHTRRQVSPSHPAIASTPQRFPRPSDGRGCRRRVSTPSNWNQVARGRLTHSLLRRLAKLHPPLGMMHRTGSSDMEAEIIPVPASATPLRCSAIPVSFPPSNR